MWLLNKWCSWNAQKDCAGLENILVAAQNMAFELEQRQIMDCTCVGNNCCNYVAWVGDSVNGGMDQCRLLIIGGAK